MTTTLLAFCRPSDGPVVKRIVLDADAQSAVGNFLNQQFTAFMEGVDDEVDFNGDWKPDVDEILTIDLPPDAKVLVAEAVKTVAALPTIDAANFEQEKIKGLFVRRPDGKVLIQSFGSQQLLLRRHWFVLDKQTFKEAKNPGFTVATHLSAVIEGPLVKFKSFPLLRRIFDLTEFYTEASDEEIEEMCQHSSLHAPDVEAVKAAMTPTIRKRMHAIRKTGVLDAYTVKQFISRANKLDVNLSVLGGKLVLPTGKKELKDFLNFMEEKIYMGALTQKLYVANSKKPYANASA